jgi:hypothetical protein
VRLVSTDHASERSSIMRTLEPSHFEDIDTVPTVRQVVPVEDEHWSEDHFWATLELLIEQGTGPLVLVR